MNYLFKIAPIVFILSLWAIIAPVTAQTSATGYFTGLEAELEQLYWIDLLPYYRPGIVEQISSYDRTGGNDDGFSGRYSFIRKEGNKSVIAELQGPGVINRIWTPTPSTDTIQFFFDGETVPRISIPFIDLFSGKVYPFIHPVCGNEVGGYYCYLPIPYQKSCKVVYTGERMQFYQIQYRTYPEETTAGTFSMNLPNGAKEALDKACKFWETKAAAIEQSTVTGTGIKEETRQFFITPGETVDFFKANKGGRIVGFEIDGGDALNGQFRDLILQANWDSDLAPAINCPVADFFGYAFGKPAMRSILLGNDAGINYCRIPMPYRKKAKLQLTYAKRAGSQPSRLSIKTKVYYSQQPQDLQQEGRLYTAWRREINPEEGKPYMIARMEGRGHYIGTIQLAQGLNPEGGTRFFEGDDVTEVDGKMRIHGTGSEDYYNGGWYAVLDCWDRGVSLPIHGSMDYSLPMERTGGYRFYLADKMTYEKDLLLTIEHGPEGNNVPVDYTSLAFYYSDRPSTGQTQPNEKLREVYFPDKHVVYPIQMNITLEWWSTQIDNKGKLIVTADKEVGLVRIMLDEIPEGKYKLYLDYFLTPDAGEFSVWNRQKMIAGWKDVHAPKESYLKKQEIGEINITRHSNSVSIKVKKTSKGNKFHFENLYLEKL